MLLKRKMPFGCRGVLPLLMNGSDDHRISGYQPFLDGPVESLDHTAVEASVPCFSIALYENDFTLDDMLIDSSEIEMTGESVTAPHLPTIFSQSALASSGQDLAITLNAW